CAAKSGESILGSPILWPILLASEAHLQERNMTNDFLAASGWIWTVPCQGPGVMPGQSEPADFAGPPSPANRATSSVVNDSSHESDYSRFVCGFVRCPGISEMSVNVNQVS